MKALNSRFLASAMAVAMAVFALGVQAQSQTTKPTPQDQTTSGGADSAIFAQTGDGKTDWGFTNGQSHGTFDADGKKDASGNAGAKSTGTNTQVLTPDSALLKSTGATTSNAAASSDKKTNKITLQGDFQAGTFASTGDPSVPNSNFGYAGGQVYGDYDGKASGKAPSGTGTAKGTDTSSSKTDNPNPYSSTTAVQTTGNSSSQLVFAKNPADCHQKTLGAVNVNGSAGLGAQSMVGDPSGTFAGGDIIGNAAYNATGQKSAAGSYVLKGTTTSKVCPDGTCASNSSTVTGSSKAAGK